MRAKLEGGAHVSVHFKTGLVTGVYLFVSRFCKLSVHWLKTGQVE